MFEHSARTTALLEQLRTFFTDHIEPAEAERRAWHHDPATAWTPWPGLETLKAEARSQGLWNLFLPEEHGEWSPGLTNLEYAPLAEQMGRVSWSSEVFNCSAPDTGNMEVLAKFGDERQQEEWLRPLLAGEIRSAFVMTEPQVASSDATNIETSIVRDGDEYVINGRKHWISGAMDPRCTIYIVMGKTDPTAPKHAQQSMVLVPAGTPGVEIIRPMDVFGDQHPPGGHVEMRFTDVRVPAENLILGEGRGFEIAQGRLGPGRIHHSMRQIGAAQRCLELMCQRGASREAFGRKLSDHGMVRKDIALSRCEIEQARYLTLAAAGEMDRVGNKAARDLISMITIVGPQMAQNVADRAIQVHGGVGVSSDTPIAEIFAHARFLRIADGPDEVHMNQLARSTVARHT
ncbi:MAG: acyl-CoA dehydrogenase family protein [Acidimicrobiales bacterium]